MQPSLEACASKLDRAQEHYAELMEEHNAWMSSGPLTFASHFESDTGWWIFTASCKKISLRYSNIVGDCISNLRAALDHLVTQLVIANGGSPTRNHQFPIYDSGADFDRAVRSRLAGVAAGHLEIIRAAQPFTAGASAAKPHALAVLNDLSNRDKHRMINAVQLVSVGPQPIQFGSNADADPIGEIRMAGGRVQRNGDEFARVYVEPVGREPLVTILEGGLQGEIILVDWGLPVGRTLAALARQVARILDQFEPIRP